MKLLKTIFFSLALTLAISCAKEGGEPPVSDEESREVCELVCAHADIVHHPAVTATAETRGNIEYWSCPDCGRRFSDAAAKEEYTGRIYILPTKYIDPSCLAGYNPFPAVPVTKDVLTAGLVASIANYPGVPCMFQVGVNGFYWTSDAYDDLGDRARARSVTFGNSPYAFSLGSPYVRSQGFSVRLVCE